uniref:protein-tyrosine-phosphatase n=1 Tax=Panagrolaimus superbus TaxID=310955 RepID=A0A914YV08_9BILA
MRIFWGKRSGRYDLSQDIFVLTINVGEYSLIQCTLNSESTSRDCLEYLRHKIDLRQREIFGIKYQVQTNDPDNRIWRFVEPDKPIKKQLDKFSCKPRHVQLSIIFYTPNVYSLIDSVARSLFYTLLKLDVISGKYTMEVEKYVNLAALSLQVDFGDYEPTLHSLDLLRSLPLLPPQLNRSIQFLDDFLLRILTAYERHSGKDSSFSAVQYIQEVMKCETYGEELFNAKDDEAAEVWIGYRLDVIVVKRSHGPALLYPFREIKAISASKRNLTLKCLDGTLAMFVLEDAELARYVCQLLNWQFKFEMTEAELHRSIPKNLKNLQGTIKAFNPPQNGINNNNNNNVVRLNSIEPCSTRTTNSFDQGASGSVCSQCPPCSTSSLLLTGVGRASSFIHGNNSTQNGSEYLQQKYLLSRERASTSDGTTPTTTAQQNQQLTFFPQTFSMMPPSISTPSIPHHYISSGAISPIIRIDPTSTSTTTPPPAALHLPFDARDVEHKILRQLLAEKRARKIGSSPEINTIHSNVRYTSNNANLNRLPVSAVGRRLNGKFHAHETLSASLSTPDLYLKCRSTPNLINSTNNNNIGGGGGGQFSQARVISSSIQQRPVGQQITYPIPTQLGGGLSSSSFSSRPLSTASGIQITGIHASDAKQQMEKPPPLENLQTLLATLRPPLDSPQGSLSDARTRSIDDMF